ncbi:hypothetical protein CYY_007651 [Polysphondylium violaceum]|uniref:Tetratricopeptide-like helical domain-containing protein n=1 Tax=Polysphondylium violaceum TaxID=133409 RepID=A0A8J4PQL8_9MYCE|nr:hypothetical protein CYY_007651 [Polysphondylium violaceum]
MISIQRLTRCKYISRLSISNSVTTTKSNIKQPISNYNSNSINNNSCNSNKTKIFSTINRSINCSKQYYFTSSKSLLNLDRQQQQQQEIDVKYQSLINDAVEQFKGRETMIAVQLLDQAIELCDNKPDAYLLRADIKSVFHKTFPSALHYDAIIQDYETAVNLVPQNKKAYVYYTISKYIGKLIDGSFEQIILYLDKAIELDPDNNDYLADKVLIASFMNRVEEIIEPSKKLVKDGSKYGPIALALISSSQENYPQAIQLIQSVIDSEVNLPRQDKFKGVPVYHGHLIVGTDRQGFIRIRDRYNGSNNNILFDSYIFLGIVYAYKGDSELCIEYYKKALEILPYAFQFHGILGSMTFQLGRFEETIEHCNNFFKHDPEFESPYANQALADRGSAYYNLGDPQSAFKDLENNFQQARFEKHKKDLILKKANSKLIMIYCLHGSILSLRLHGFDKSKNNLEAMIKDNDQDSDGILLVEPKNIQQLLARTRLLLATYHNISNSIQNGLVMCSEQEATNIYLRETFFFYLTDYLIDSMYLNHIENHSDIYFHGTEILDFISQLPYKESKQLPERQEAHKILFNIYKEIMSHIQENDF